VRKQAQQLKNGYNHIDTLVPLILSARSPGKPSQSVPTGPYTACSMMKKTTANPTNMFRSKDQEKKKPRNKSS
jgi:hypothetical protein